jgi:hypothetical protein
MVPRPPWCTLAKTPTRIGAWIRQLLTRAYPNVVVVALAAKMARIVWAVLRHDHAFE